MPYFTVWGAVEFERSDKREENNGIIKGMRMRMLKGFEKLSNIVGRDTNMEVIEERTKKQSVVHILFE